MGIVSNDEKNDLMLSFTLYSFANASTGRWSMGINKIIKKNSIKRIIIPESTQKKPQYKLLNHF